ncbi:MAG: hypothetical protein GX893_02020 [Firmicutes bacterium]|nr:hypothetical protein [Bacillota bacterium]
MPKKGYFQKLYKFEAKNQHYLIEVSLDDYDDVYDSWDPSPFKRRDIEDEFHDYILNSSEDIPLKYKLSIILYLPLEKKNEGKEKALISAYRNYYSYTLARFAKNMKKLRQKNIYSLFMSIVFLSIGYYWGSRVSSVLLKVVQEGIFIGGWVFLWDFFTDIFITRRKHFEEYKLYERLYQADLRFVYRDNAGNIV